jgi:F420-non-reducing hydrogenase iron-sulfur subunit
MTIKRMTFLQELLAFIGLEGRLHLEWISSAEAQKFARVVTDFTETVRALGPNPIRDWRVFDHLCDARTAAANASHAGGA